MTCIVGLKDKNNVYIGCDSLGSNGVIKTNRVDSKVFKKNDFLIGFTSSYRMGQILQYNLVVTEQTSKQDDFEYMCTSFINGVRKCLKEGGYTKIDSNVESGGFFLVGYKKELYEVQCDFQVSIIKEPYNSCGSGMYFALGSLHESVNVRKEKDHEKIITNAIKAASYFSPSVGGDIKIEKL